MDNRYTVRSRGMTISATVKSFEEAKAFVYEIVCAGIARCVSPERHELCDAPATRVHWQDQAEWYECCDKHWPTVPQWCGSTRWRGYEVSVTVIPDLAEVWLGALPPERRATIEVDEYVREP